MSAALAQNAQDISSTTAPVIPSFQLPADLGFKALRLSLLALFSFAMIGALHPEMRNAIRQQFVKETRTVISTVSGDIQGTGTTLTVVKVKTGEGLFLEVYDPQTDGTQKLVEKIGMMDTKDGYFNFNGHATNLAIEDIDGDGKPEILAPTFDQNLVGHLNVYRFDSSAQSFKQVMR